MQANSLLHSLAVDLNDAAAGHEYTVWSAAQLGTYLLEAVGIVSTRRPDLFIEERIIELDPCTSVQQACDCSSIKQVLGQSTASGRVIKELRRRSNEVDLRWTGRTVCKVPPASYEPEEYSIDSASNRIWIYPPPPPGKSIYVLVECSVIPDDWTDFDISTELLAMVKQWVLWRAKSVDGEHNPDILTVAIAHRDTFWQLLNLAKEEYDEQVESDDA